LVAALIEVTEELLKTAGFVKIGVQWVSADDAKAAAR